MLRRISFITAFTLLFISLAAVPMTSKAYISPEKLFDIGVLVSVKNCSLKPAYDGVYIIQTSYKSFHSPDFIDAPVKLDKTQFLSGTWNGQTINELDSQYLYNIDVTGFSQTVSYSDEKDYFVYSLVTCLPVKAGDDFNIIFNINTANVKESSHTTVISYIPGGTGCRMVHSENGTVYPENPLTYTVCSENQHIALVFNPDTFNTDYVNTGFSRSFSNRFNCETVSGLNFVGMHSKSVDIFTTSYNHTGDISVTLKDSIDNYSFSVYEIFTDGTVTPGYNTEGEQPTSSAGSGSSDNDSDETSKGIFDSVKNIFIKIHEISDFLVELPHKFAEMFGNLQTYIVNSIKGFFQDAKDFLIYLFKPSDNNFEKCKEVIDDKFKFVHQALDYYKNFVNFTFLDKPPDTYVTIYGETISFMNWDLYDKYKPMIDNIIVFCAWYLFIRRLVKRIPGIIGGFHT